MAYVQPKLDLKRAQTGDPLQRELEPIPANEIEANDRRTIRQAIMTQLMREVADEIIAIDALKVTYPEKKIVGNLREFYDAGKLPKLRKLIETPEKAFNDVRDLLKVSLAFGSINLVVFRSAMALGDGKSPVDPEEVAIRAVIRSGVSGKHRERGFAGCK